MPVEFIGLVATQEFSEIVARPGPLVDLEFTRRIARAHEDNDFDQVLIGYASTQPDGLQVAAYAAAHTERLSYLVAQRPGFLFPTVAARAFATLDQFTGGRLALNIITGGSDAEQRRDGDYLAKDDRYDRTDEFLQILRQAWTADAPFSFAGKHYRFDDFIANVRPTRPDGVPIYFSGSSDAAYRVGARHADVYMFWGEPLAQVAEQIDRVRQEAAAAGRAVPRFSVSFRPILGATEELAWARAEQILDRITGKGLQEQYKSFFRSPSGSAVSPQNAGSQRLLAAAAQQDRHDRALWTAPAKATGAAGNSTALVGTPETVAAALLDYYDIGVTTFLIRGYDPYDDVLDYGRDLIPTVRAEIARRDAAPLPAGAAEAS
ncbi:MAG: LLM class flavin-dependent oxidoreductase [Actinomycetota bacterium]|nr:MAG: LLM class flavin-dependent oxidoreductase [Actinomycetota bacterium]